LYLSAHSRILRFLAETVEGLIHEEMVRAIARQQIVLDGLRNRAATLLAATSLVTAFLAGQVFDRTDELDWVAWLAILGFLAVGVLVLSILWPWRFQFVMSAKGMEADYLPDDREIPVPAVQKSLGEWYETLYDRNQPTIDRLFWVFRCAALLLVFDVIAWIFAMERG
jgi:hypothetical protein